MAVERAGEGHLNAADGSPVHLGEVDGSSQLGLDIVHAHGCHAGEPHHVLGRGQLIDAAHLSRIVGIEIDVDGRVLHVVHGLGILLAVLAVLPLGSKLVVHKVL